MMAMTIHSTAVRTIVPMMDAFQSIMACFLLTNPAPLFTYRKAVSQGVQLVSDSLARCVRACSAHTAIGTPHFHKENAP